MADGRANLSLSYGYLGPMWVQTSSTATANVRVLGPSTMAWQDVSFQLGNLAPGTSLAQTIIPVGDTGNKGHRYP